jgi:hypothetical protein
MTIPVGLPWLRHSRLTRCDEVEELVEGSTLVAELARAVVERCSERGGWSSRLLLQGGALELRCGRLEAAISEGGVDQLLRTFGLGAS